MQQTLLDEDDFPPLSETIRRFTPIAKSSRSDVRFPLSTPRRQRAPSVSCMTDVSEKEEQLKLPIRARDVEREDSIMSDKQPTSQQPACSDSPAVSGLSICDLPLEVQGKVLDYIFGEVHAVNSTSTSLRR